MSLGIGAMLHALGGGSPKSPEDYYGRTITKAEQVGDELRIAFSDGAKIRIYDDGQSCCENRYMRTDDALADLVGHRLVAIETNRNESQDDEDLCGTHDAVFLDIKTDAGVVSFSFHNEHNGYYGGFGLALDEEIPA